MESRVHTGTRVSLIGIGANTGLALFKLAAGILGGSSAMISDSMHSFSDSVSTVAVLIGLRIADAPADREHPYGHGRAETVAAKLVALLLMATALAVGYSAYSVLRRSTAVEPGIFPLAAAVVSIISKESLYRYTLKAAKQINSRALEADAWHHRTDALSSVTALLGIAGARWGLLLLDPLAGMIVSVMIFRTGFLLYWRSVEELVDTAPGTDVLNHIQETAAQVPGVLAVQDVKARVHGAYLYVDLIICVDATISVQAGHAIAHKVAEQLRALPDIKDVLVHVNPWPTPQAQPPPV